MKLYAVVGKTGYKLKTVVDDGLLFYITKSLVQGFSKYSDYQEDPILECNVSSHCLHKLTIEPVSVI
jgi:hypothetical protein